MKYKVGDKVRIKSLDWYNRYTNGTEVDCGAYPFTSDMKEFTKKIIEEQVDVPPEIMEVVDEHFFEML